MRHAVDRIVEHCGPEARDLILAPGSKLTRGRVIALGERSSKEEAKIIGHLGFHAKLPRWFKVTNGPPTMSVPRVRTTGRRILRRDQGGVFQLNRRISLCDSCSLAR